jgi:GH18 family chitinase
MPPVPPLFRRLVVCVLAVVAITAAARAQSRVVAYVPNWVDLNSFSASIDYAKLTHINIAFENPTNDRGDVSFHPKNQALIARARAQRVRVLVSLAGGGVASDAALKQRWFELIGPVRRAAFVTKLADYVVRHGVDGFDVDLEGPAINQDYGPFIRELSAALKPRGKLLTAALSQGYGGTRVPDDVLPLFDFINVMAYDGAGHWAPERPGQHASMELARSSVRYWLQRGVARDRVVLGVPFYGYGFGEAFRKRGYSYAGIVSTYPGAEHADQAGSTIWYNGIPTIRAKAQYVVDEGLGGIMIWSLDYDTRDERSLLAAIYATLTANWVTRSLPRQP